MKTPARERTEQLVAFIGGSATAEEVAARLGVDPAEVPALARAYGWALKDLSAPRRKWRARAALAVVAVSTVAWGQALVTFNPDEPARAADVNNNFNALKAWIEQKVGPVGTATISASSLVIGAPGAQATLTANAQGQLSLSGGLAMPDSNAGISTSRMSVAASVPNGTSSNFSGGFLEGTFGDPGGTITILASATGWCSTAGRITMLVKVDGLTVGSMRAMCNVVGSHMAFPPAFIRLNRSGLSTPFGPSVIRTVRLEPVNCALGCNPGLVTTNADVNDYGEVTVIRLPTP